MIHNKDVPLWWMKFSNNTAQIEEILSHFDVGLCDYDFTHLDALAETIYGDVAQRYKNRVRKLALFDLPVKAVAYFDCDIVFFQPIHPLFEVQRKTNFDVICTSGRNDPWVYNSNYKNYAQLRASLRFSDGCLVLKCGAISTRQAIDLLRNNLGMFHDVRADGVYSQPVTNFVADLSGLRVGTFWRYSADVSPRTWFKDSGFVRNDRSIADEKGRSPIFMHWAGFNMESDVDRFAYVRQQLLEAYHRRVTERPV